jgi:hypothetical protein
MTKMDEEWEMHNVDNLLLLAKNTSVIKDKRMYLSGAAAIILLRELGFGHPHNIPPVPPDNRIVDAHTHIMESNKSYAELSGGGNKIRKTKRRNPKKSVRHRRHNKKSIRHRKKTLMSY